MSENSLPHLLKLNYEKHGAERVAMRHKDYGIYKEWTWQEYYENVKNISLGLVSMGLIPGDIVAIMGDNAPEFYWAELACQAGGGITVGMFPDQALDEIEFILNECQAKFMIVDDQEQVDKLLELKHKFPALTKIAYWDPKGLWSYDDPMLMSLQDMMDVGRAYEKAHPGVFEENIGKVDGDDVAIILYTSGTTGMPKGVVRSHNSMIKCMEGQLITYPLNTSDDHFSAMPLAWAPDQMYGVVQSLSSGMKVNFAETPETVNRDMREVGVTWIMLSPRLWEALSSQVTRDIMDSTWSKRKLYELFLPVGYRLADIKLSKQRPNVFWRIVYGVASAVLFRQIKDQLGLSKAKHVFTAGEMMSPELFRYFHGIGVPIKQLFGGTEAGSPLGHRDDDILFDSLGFSFQGCDVRFTNEGEMLLRGEGLANEYYKRPEATGEAFENGWFHTGDVGYINKDNHICVWDRLADITELNDGTQYAPKNIEVRLKFNAYIREAIIIGGKTRDYLTAIINIDFPNVAQWAEKRRLAYTSFADLSQNPEVCDLIRRGIEVVNRNLPDNLQIRRFINLFKEFDPDEAELTRTRKLKRGRFEERYATMISAMYGDQSEVPVQVEVQYQDGKTSTTEVQLRINNLVSEMTP